MTILEKKYFTTARKTLFLLSISDVRGQGLFSARFSDRWLLSAIQKLWSGDNIFASLQLVKHGSRDVVLVVPAAAKSGLPVSRFPAFVKVQRGKMSFVQFKIFYGDNFERCKMHRMKGLN